MTSSDSDQTGTHDPDELDEQPHLDTADEVMPDAGSGDDLAGSAASEAADDD